MLTTLRKTRFYRLFLWLSSILCFIILISIAISFTTKPSWLVANDYVGYWSAGYLNYYGGDPYDPGQLLSLQLSTGKPDENVVMMWTPPWVLTLMMPFSVLEFPFSYGIWTLMNLFALFLSIKIIWDIYAWPQSHIWFGWVIAFTFIPVLDVLNKGQLGALLLLGVGGFLYFTYKKENDWIAGAFLALLTIKPHTLYLLTLAAIFWASDKRRWKILTGATFTLIITTFIAWSVNNNIFQQYYLSLLNYPPEELATPTIGGVLRLITGPDNFWLQFLPTVLGLAWFLLLYWSRNRKTWDWRIQAPLLILVSFVTTSYGWSFDQPAALIAIFQVALLIILQSKWESSFLCIILGYIFILFINLITRANDFFLFWFAPAILLWYLVSMKILRKRTRTEQLIAPEPKIISPQ